MPSVFRPTTIDDEGQIVAFLTRIFGVPPDEPFVESELLRWKYWAPRPDCSDPRSFVIERDGTIVAHVGLWPITLRTGQTCERGVQMIDWASDPQTPGMGISLLQRLTRSYDFVYSIGGSEITQSLLPKFGFRTVAEARTWARPIRPWRQMLHHQSRDRRLPVRLARNLWWSKKPARLVPPGWTYVSDGPDSIAGPAIGNCEREAAFFRYLQQCPAAPTMAFHAVHDGRKCGYFALSVSNRQARVAGVWLEDPSPENWRTAFHLAQDAALKHTCASELIARGTTEASAAGAQMAGMRERARTPVLLFRKSADTGSLPLQYQLCDDDSVFLRGRLAGFLT